MNKVYLTFYNLKNTWHHKVIKLLTRAKYTHVGIVIKTPENSLEMWTNLGEKKTGWVSEKALRKFYTPDKILYLGENNTKLSQLMNVLSDSNIVQARSVWFWWWIGRFIFPTMLPQTCSSITCHILRVCGFNIQIHVHPIDLYKEIHDENYNYIRASWSWEDYSCSDYWS
jgi:hypothetical protein